MFAGWTITVGCSNTFQFFFSYVFFFIIMFNYSLIKIQIDSKNCKENKKCKILPPQQKVWFECKLINSSSRAYSNYHRPAYLLLLAKLIRIFRSEPLDFFRRVLNFDQEANLREITNFEFQRSKLSFIK
jgi:hypothetical protein